MTAVSDELMANAVGISCYSTYTHALLLGLADPCAMSVKQIELADRWLGMWSRKVFPYAQQRETEGPVIVVDLESPGRRRAVGDRAAPGAGVDALRLSGQARHQRARPPEAAADGRQPRRAAARSRLQRRAVHDAARASRCALVPGATRAAEAPRRTSISAVAASAPRTSASAAARSTARIRWGACRSREPSICRRWMRSPTTTAARGRRAHVGLGALERQLRVARGRADAPGGNAPPLAARAARRRPRRRARSRRLRHPRRPGRPRRARAVAAGSGPRRRGRIAVRPFSTAVTEDPPVPALLLAETPDDKACLILPPRTFNPSRVLRSLDSGPSAATGSRGSFSAAPISSASRSKKRFREPHACGRISQFGRCAAPEADAVRALGRPCGAHGPATWPMPRFAP